MSRRLITAGAALLLVGLIGLGLWGWLRPAPVTSPLSAPPRATVDSGRVEPAPAPAPAAAVASASAASTPSVQYPLAASAAAEVVELRDKDVAAAVQELLGRKTVLRMLQLDDFARRVAATVDNLGRQQAPSRLWPVNPMAGQFMVAPLSEGATVINADNARRYTPLLLMIERLEPAQVVGLYLRLYPLLQRAYEELGFPGRYFNDRVVEVIDLLLAAPDATAAERVQLTEVKGPVPSTRPWVRYEFADPALESLSAGQKIMLRVGPVNQRRLRSVLQAWRAELLKHSPR